MIFSIFLLKTLIVGTRRGGSNYRHFGSKIRKNGIPLYTQLYYIKVGYEVVYVSWICFPDGTIGNQELIQRKPSLANKLHEPFITECKIK